MVMARHSCSLRYTVSIRHQRPGAAAERSCNIAIPVRAVTRSRRCGELLGGGGTCLEALPSTVPSSSSYVKSGTTSTVPSESADPAPPWRAPGVASSLKRTTERAFCKPRRIATPTDGSLTSCASSSASSPGTARVLKVKPRRCDSPAGGAAPCVSGSAANLTRLGVFCTASGAGCVPAGWASVPGSSCRSAVDVGLEAVDPRRARRAVRAH
mmetsp:Transcript_5156/g.15084  ORF Transcript_5156/g.15084 Transcript_5156/m.15084 type:complete len:212 (-) Transcript_5156:2677-3312(-)